MRTTSARLNFCAREKFAFDFRFCPRQGALFLRNEETTKRAFQYWKDKAVRARIKHIIVIIKTLKANLA